MRKHAASHWCGFMVLLQNWQGQLHHRLLYSLNALSYSPLHSRTNTPPKARCLTFWDVFWLAECSCEEAAPQGGVGHNANAQLTTHRNYVFLNIPVGGWMYSWERCQTYLIYVSKE